MDGAGAVLRSNHDAGRRLAFRDVVRAADRGKGDQEASQAQRAPDFSE